MMDNSYAEMETALVNNFHVVMGNNSGLNIKNGTGFGRQGNDINQGFFAKDDNAVAYVRLGGVTKVPFHNTPCALQVSGAHLTFCYETMNFYNNYSWNIWTNNFEGASYWDQGDAATIATQKSYGRTWQNNGAIEAAVSDANFAPIKDGECSATWEEHGKEKEKEYPIYSYAFEDTHMGDYDMNDVVLKVQENEDGEHIDIKLVAAGATLDLNIRLYDYDESGENGYGENYTTLSYNGETEIHKMWGVDAGTMVNTGAGATANPIMIQIAKTGYDPSKLRLAIYSASQGEMRLAGSGQAPYGVVIPADWAWPKERVRITTAYNQENASDQDEANKDQSFKKFATEVGKAELWYNYPTSSVMK
jgi:hypothetical protein